MNNYPKRPASHSNGDKAVAFFKERCPKEWIIHEISHDYGLDLRIELVKSGIVTGQEFYVQIKRIKLPVKKETAYISIRQATINYWLSKLRPVVIVGVDIDKRQFIFEWLEKAYANYPNYSNIDSDVRLQIPIKNVANKFEKGTTAYVSDFFLKLSSDLTNVFENTQLSRILFHASELHRLATRTVICFFGEDIRTEAERDHRSYLFLFEFSFHDRDFNDLFELYKSKKTERFDVLDHYIFKYREIREKFYMKGKCLVDTKSNFIYVPVNYSEVPQIIKQLINILDELIGILFQALLLGKFIFPKSHDNLVY